MMKTNSIDGDGIVQIQIKTIADHLEMVSDNSEHFLNTQTGEIVFLFNDFSGDADEALADEIEYFDHYVRLPNQYDINEWKIMESFSLEITLKSVREQLLSSLHGKKAYRCFKDTLNRLGIAEDYYDYRKRAYYKIAEDWCRENNIAYDL